MKAFFSAILGDDRAAAKALLQQDPGLATNATATVARYDEGIAHWIYVGDSALHVAAAGYRVEIASWLLAAGANPKVTGNHRRSCPLHYAADGCLESPNWDARRQVAMIRMLIEAGADVQAPDKNGATPLHRAVRTRCAAAVACLLEAGSDATLRNKPGSTPFHLAVQNTGRGGSGAEKAKAAQGEIIRAFLDRGISTALTDGNGKSILQWARSDSIRAMLQGRAG